MTYGFTSAPNFIQLGLERICSALSLAILIQGNLELTLALVIVSTELLKLKEQVVSNDACSCVKIWKSESTDSDLNALLLNGLLETDVSLVGNVE